ncbi:uncharacterized protein LOC127843782 isoform X3 [Dreissena polymorpha]|uniref:uncharacterized protein LOC127843782 isoform X3 n=1 Tax=Dreissena polymorpha TaxID=45954 RepID=UPI00226441F3|nr:uncharacterized protein LOC127843782 isoform X3 [Dreissena polymorpha]
MHAEYQVAIFNIATQDYSFPQTDRQAKSNIPRIIESRGITRYDELIEKRCLEMLAVSPTEQMVYHYSLTILLWDHVRDYTDCYRQRHRASPGCPNRYSSRRHLSTAMSQVSDFSRQTLVQHGQELISALLTLARPQRSVTPEPPRRAPIPRQPTGDRRRSTIVRFKACALDHPLYTSTATVNQTELLTKGLGRRPDTTFSLPSTGTQSDLRNKIIELYPILHTIPFELMVGQARCKLELIPREKSLQELKADTKSCGFVRLWVLPDYHIGPQITAPTSSASMPTVTLTPAILSTPAVRTTPAIPSTPAIMTTLDIPSMPAVTTMPDIPSTPADTTSQAILSMPAIMSTPAILSTPALTTTPAVEIDYDLQIDVPEIQNAQSDSLYEPAGTPTVLFRRQQTVFDIARPSRITDTARERLQQLASTCITGPITDPMLLEVRRNHVMKDALGTIRYSQDDLSSKLQIKFIGEAGVDLGGLRREFFSLLVYQFSHSALTSGSPGRLTFRKNYVEREKNTFFYLGQLVALSILQDGPGLPVFADCCGQEDPRHQNQWCESK